MELEFDKEIDAILRKARAGISTGTVTADPHHIDADAIAAFAENALPQKAKLLYMGHFADCDRCRKLLSQAILMHTEADAAAASIISAPVVEASVPWYQKLFITQNLAIAMGGLILIFSGVLGFLVLQNRQGENATTVSQVTESERAPGGPYFGGEDALMNSNMANTAANAVVPATNVMTNSVGSSPPAGMTSNAAGLNADQPKPAPADDMGVSRNEAISLSNKPAAAAPPPPSVTMDGLAVADRDERRKDSEKLAKTATEDSKDLAARQGKRMEERSLPREAPRAAAKSGPSRGAGPTNQQTQLNTQAYEMPVTRIVGGKTFRNNNGAWYDSTYQGQATINVRRATDEYKKLDSGLRSIANNLGGTVVIVQRGKAYRIQ